MFVEIHLLQNFAPSNLNRDDTNSPKDCTFGGFRRARISSQCLKRAIRTDRDFKQALGKYLGQRTKLVHQDIVKRLKAKSYDEAEARVRTRRALEAVEFAWDEDPQKDRMKVLLFVSDMEVDRWAEVIHAHWDELGARPTITKAPTEGDKKPKKKTNKEKKAEKASAVPETVKKALKEAMKAKDVRAIDIALFGRMVAENTDMNIAAACQVAHAISTHAVQIEMDFFTAVDDLQPTAETGAGMMGVVEFNSACFYRYVLIDTEQLKKNLGSEADSELLCKAVLEFCKATIRAIPSGKQNSFAARNPPDYVRVEVRKNGSPRSLVNAFADPVRTSRADSDLVGLSIERAETYATTLANMLDGDDDEQSPEFIGKSTTRKDLVGGAMSLPNLWKDLERALKGGSM